ncbi:hypothetical protein FS749_000963 [Ceratobasidium sp. UAMH 11750]|nr:hypothetical protein FS749_000963 [Ceratobasidium sp. UAMH 11750]
MSEESKKPRLDSTIADTPASSSPSNDLKLLKKSLNRCNPPFFIRSLCKSLDDFSPETLQTLAQALDPVLEIAATLQHCVRCHKLFSEAGNTGQSCAVPCNINFSDWDACPIFPFKFDCCDRKWTKDKLKDHIASGQGLVCYAAEHTIDPTSVKYHYLPLGHKREKGINYRGDNRSVRTCKIMECRKTKSRK